MRRSGLALVTAVLFCGLYAPGLRAQSYLQSVGTPSFTTQLPVENGFVNIANGNLHLEIPLGSFAERGGGIDKLVLMYDSAIWTWSSGYRLWTPTNISSAPQPPFGRGGWRLTTSGDVGESAYGEYDYSWCPAVDDYAYATYSPWIWTAPDGTQHSFPASTTEPLYPGTCGSSGTPNSGAYASDGSGFYISITNYTDAVVYAPDGTANSVSIYPAVKNDSNGNPYTTSFTAPYDLKLLDTLSSALNNRPVVEITESSDGNTFYYAVPKAGGGTNTYTVKLETINFDTDFGQSGVIENSGSFQAVSEIDLPDGTAYYFNYDSGTTSGHYGLLTSMTLPTGGTIYYSFGNYTDPYGNVARWINHRTTPDSSTGWSYSSQVLSTCTSAQVNCQQLITATAPSGDTTQYTLTLNGGSWLTFLRSGSLAYTSVCYSFVTASAGSCSYAVTTAAPATNVYKTWESDTLYNNGAPTKTTEYAWEGNDGNLTTLSEWNYGSSPSNAADRTTTITYYENGHNINHPSQVTVAAGGANVSQTAYGYDAGSSCACGNLTSVTRWLNTGTSPVTYYTYTGYGMPATMKDPNGNTTTYNYDGSGVYLSSIVYPTPSSGVQQTEGFSFDDNSGAILSYTDRNHNETSYSYDGIGRPEGISYPDGGQTTFSYPSATLTEMQQKIDSSGHYKTTNTVIDGLGRQMQTQLASDPEGTDYTDTTYDADGRVATVSNPHRSTGSYTDGTTQYQYDGLNRVKAVIEQDGSEVSMSYSGNCETVVDEAGKTRTSCTDGWGRLTSLAEDPNGLNLVTTYGYDANNNLISVVQGGSHNRTFGYNSLSRLTSAANPESGQTTYTYDANGNVVTRTDARGIVTNYSPAASPIDALNRVTEVTYTDGTPTAQFFYDETGPWGWPTYNTTGRLSREQSVQGSTVLAGSAFSYDTMGRVIHRGQCTPTTCGWSGFDASNGMYNGLGELVSFTHPMEVSFTRIYDNAGHFTQLASSFSDARHPGTLATVDPSTGYWPTGQIEKMTLGNGLLESTVYEPRIQACRRVLYSSGTPPAGCSDPYASGNIEDFGFVFGNWGVSNNGDITQWNAYGQQWWGRIYNYDSLDRLTSLSDPNNSNPCPGLTWTYDAFGNRQTQTVTSGSCGSWNATYDASNHITNSGYSYDAAGNLKTDGSHTYYYDAENRLIQVDGTLGTCSTATACYTYDAEGNRAEKIAGSSKTEYAYDLEGDVTLEDDGNSGVWGSVYLYVNNQLLAEYTPGWWQQPSTGTTEFFFQDNVGSTRIVTDANGNVVDSMDYAPFGEEIAGDTATTHKFTGQERDAESAPYTQPNDGMDHFSARYYSSLKGRFMTPDPLGIFGADLTDPQQLNLYTYVRNNPVTLFDPTGMDFDGVDGCDPSEGCINIGFGGGGGPEPPIDRQPPIYMPPGNGPNVNPPTGATNPNDPFSGETFGIPNGMGIPLRNLAGILLPEDSGCDLGVCGPFINSWTAEGGVSIQITVWGLAFQAFYGVAIDLHGHVAIYRGGGGGIGLGAKVSTGISLSASNGNTVCALGGPFTNVSGTAGAGAGGTVDVFTGKGDAPGGVVWGAGGTIGPTVGAAGGVTVTGTNVKPVRHRCVNGKLQ